MHRKYVLFNKLGLKRTQNESPVLLSVPPTLSRDSHEHICQIFFERFNSAAVSILERPLAQLFATNNLTGLVVDIGDDTTDVSPISDCLIQHNCCESIPIGISDCEKYLASLLKTNEGVVDALSPSSEPLDASALQEALLALSRHVWKEGLIKISESDVTADAEEEGVTNIAAVLVAGKEKAVIESGMKKRANAKASAAEQARAKEIEALDLVTTEFEEKEITLGRERHRFLDPLFDPSVLQGVEGVEEKVWNDNQPLPIQDVIGRAVGRTDLNSRIALWDGFFVTGDCTSLVKGIGIAIQTRLTPYLLGNPDIQNDVQPKNVRVLHVPEYFAEYRERGDGFAAFLGASVVAKVRSIILVLSFFRSITSLRSSLQTLTGRTSSRRRITLPRDHELCLKCLLVYFKL